MSSKERTVRIKQLDLSTIPESAKIVIIGKPGCFSRGTKVRMYDGSVKNVESIQIGDKIMGDDSTERVVSELCRGFDVMYTVKSLERRYFFDYKVNREHILTLYSSSEREVIDIPLNEFLKRRDRHLFRWIRKGYEINSSNFSLSKDDRNFLIRQVNTCVLYKKIPEIFFSLNRKDRILLLSLILTKIREDNCCYINSRGEIALIYNNIANLIEFIVSLNYKIREDHRGRLVIYRFDKALITELLKIGWDISELLNNLEENSDLDLSPFSLKEESVEEYFGFIIDKNKRFLLSNGTVVHNTGKSTLIESIVYSKRHIYPAIQVFSGTEDSNGTYQKFVHPLFIYNEFDLDAAKNFVVRQKTAMRYLKPPTGTPYAIQIIDDCSDDPKIFNKPLIQKYYKNGRHWNMLHIMSLQYALDIKPVIRGNIDGVFILRESNPRNRKILFENYAACIKDFADFCDIMDALTTDYTAIYINNRVQSNKIEDCVFYYKATPPPAKWRFGSEDLWLFAEERYNENYTEPLIA